MRPLKIKAKVLEDYNDSLNDGKLVEKDAIIELDYNRFEFLKSIGKVEEFEEEKQSILKKIDKEEL